MKDFPSVLCAASLSSFLLCLLCLLLPLQYSHNTYVSQEIVSHPSVLFSLSPQQLSRIHFQSNNESFTLVNLGNHFVLEGYETLSLRSNLITELTALLEQFPLSSYIVEESNSSDLQITIESTSDNVVLSISKSSDNLLLTTETQTFLYTENQLEPLLACAEDFIDLNILSLNTSSTDFLRLSGTLHEEALEISFDEEYSQTLQDSLQHLQAREVICLSPSPEDFDFFGLDEPFCSLEIHSNCEQHALHCSAPQSDGTIYLWKEDQPVIYSTDITSLPFLTVTKEVLSEESLFSTDYDDTTKLYVESADTAFTFTKWDGQVLCKGKPVDEENFHRLHQFCTTLIPQQALLLPPKEEALLLQLCFSYTNPEKVNDTISFYSYNDEFCSLSINGEKMFLVKHSLPENILSYSIEIS